MVLGDASRAVQAASLALSKDPTDARSQLDYALALSKSGGKIDSRLAGVKKSL